MNRATACLMVIRYHDRIVGAGGFGARAVYVVIPSSSRALYFAASASVVQNGKLSVTAYQISDVYSKGVNFCTPVRRCAGRGRSVE